MTIISNEGSASGSFAKSLGSGLNNLIDKKISDLQKKQGIIDKKGWLKKAKMPEWLAEVEDPKVFEKLVTEFDYLSPQEKKQVSDALNTIPTGADGKPDINAAAQKEDARLDQEDEVDSTQQVSGEQQSGIQEQPGMQQTPMGQQQPMGVQPPAEDMGRGESTISGLNSLMNAGNGQEKNQAMGSPFQSFPQEGHTTNGSAAPAAGGQPYANGAGIADTEGYSRVRKSSGAGSDAELKREKFEQAKKEQSFKEQQSLVPFLETQEKESKENNKIKKIAERMKGKITKLKDKWPSPVLGVLPHKAQELLIRDPDIRDLIKDSKDLIIHLGQSRKGMPTKYKLDLEDMAKANISMPYSTAKRAVENVIGDIEEEREVDKYIDSQRDSKGNYPLDIARRANSYREYLESNFEIPEGAQQGDVYEDDNGNKWTFANGEMKRA